VGREHKVQPKDIVGAIAGETGIPGKAIGANECAKIMTGAMVPDGADCVIMVEHTEVVSENTIRFVKEQTKDNICFRGEDIRAGDVVLSRGDLIQPQHIAVLATVGCIAPMVARRPRVGVIATGSELVEPSEKATGAKIRNSNGWQLAAQAEQMNCIVNYYGIAEDTETVLDALIKKAISENDVLLLSGGVSVGDFDLIPGILKQNGIELLFDRVAIKPGKPSTFGTGQKIRCFALPGNPVATFIQFETLVKPFLYKMAGHSFRPRTVRAKIQCDIKRNTEGRTVTLPVRFTAIDQVTPVVYHGSAHINAMCEADGLLFIQTSETSIKKGDEVDVRLL
ncbi:MAG: molybdopterin molybdotransferase MoeA, partial [Pontiellaceae bacterium]|nr:molybdopterin molybdotransferase MoeA [Pontiellaceae bacterium]